jgi:hypothetical protein
MAPVRTIWGCLRHRFGGADVTMGNEVPTGFSLVTRLKQPRHSLGIGLKRPVRNAHCWRLEICFINVDRLTGCLLSFVHPVETRYTPTEAHSDTLGWRWRESNPRPERRQIAGTTTVHPVWGQDVRFSRIRSIQNPAKVGRWVFMCGCQNRVVLSTENPWGEWPTKRSHCRLPLRSAVTQRASVPERRISWPGSSALRSWSRVLVMAFSLKPTRSHYVRGAMHQPESPSKLAAFAVVVARKFGIPILLNANTSSST